MRPLAAIGHGVREVARQWPSMIWLHICGFVFAMPAAFVFGELVDRFVADSALAADFARRLDPSLVMELVREEPEALVSSALAALLCVGLWLIQSVLLGGGLLVALGPGRPRASLRDLLEGGGRVFGRLSRLLPLGLILMLVFGALPLGLLHAAAKRLSEGLDERSIFVFRATAIAIGLVCLALANATYDLMRIECAQNEQPVLRAAWAGLRRAARQPHRLLAVYLPFVALAWGVTLLGALVDVQISRSGVIALVLAVLLQQGSSLVRVGLRIGLAAGESQWLRSQS